MIPLRTYTDLTPSQTRDQAVEQPLNPALDQSLGQSLGEFTPFRARRLSSNMAGKITQIIMQDQDEYNFQLLMPLLAQLSRDDRWFAWIAPPLKLPKHWLLEAGIDINKIMMLQPRGGHDTLALARKALATGTCHAVISWPGQISQEQLSQLEDAARLGRSHAIVIQPR